MATSDWAPVTLGDLIDIKHGFAFKGEFFRDNPTPDILLTPGNFAIGGGFKDDKLKHYAGPVPSDYILEEGDLIVTMTDLSKDADTLGYPAFVPKVQAYRYLHNQRLGKILIRDGAPIRKDYLYFLLCSIPYRNEVLASATGTTVKHTSPERIKAFKFLLPTLPEQEGIAQILGAFTDKIELNRQMNKTLDILSQTFFKSWFIDFDPVQAKMEAREPFGMDAETAAIFPDSFEVSALGRIPKGWKVKPIGDVVKVVGGSTPSTKNPAYWEQGTIHWATPKDLSLLSSSVLLDTERCITELGLQQISSGLLPKGTVLLSSRAPIGYLAIAEMPVAINQGFIALVCDGELPNHYALCWLQENMSIIEGRANGTTFQEISKANFRPIQIIVPPTNILDRFIDLVGVFHRQIVSNLKQSDTLTAIPDALLPKLLSGEISAKNAEKYAEAQL